MEGQSRRGGTQLAGRDPFHRVVNFSTESEFLPTPGSLLPLEIVDATPHSLIGVRLAVRDSAFDSRTVKSGLSSADEQEREAATGS